VKGIGLLAICNDSAMSLIPPHRPVRILVRKLIFIEILIATSN
jgi:hypothetical protein